MASFVKLTERHVSGNQYALVPNTCAVFVNIDHIEFIRENKNPPHNSYIKTTMSGFSVIETVQEIQELICQSNLENVPTNPAKVFTQNGVKNI